MLQTTNIVWNSFSAYTYSGTLEVANHKYFQTQSHHTNPYTHTAWFHGNLSYQLLRHKQNPNRDQRNQQKDDMSLEKHCYNKHNTHEHTMQDTTPASWAYAGNSHQQIEWIGIGHHSCVHGTELCISNEAHLR